MRLYISGIIMGTLLIIFIFVILFIIVVPNGGYSLKSYECYRSWPLESTIEISILSAFIGGITTGYLSSKSGWLNGALAGILASILLTLSFIGLKGKFLSGPFPYIDIWGYPICSELLFYSTPLAMCIFGALGGCLGHKYRLYRRARKEK